MTKGQVLIAVLAVLATAAVAIAIVIAAYKTGQTNANYRNQFETTVLEICRPTPDLDDCIEDVREAFNK